VPIVKLFVEGNLEMELLNSIFQGSPVLQQGGSKNALRPRARSDRADNKVAAGYLRDRDFDYEPPNTLTEPTVDCTENNSVAIGWRWCRHETENYLLEPSLVHAAMQWSIREVEDAIFSSATKIRYYEAARWTIGTVRRVLPPNFELRTRPNLNEIALPKSLDVFSTRNWAEQSISEHRMRILESMAPDDVSGSFDQFAAKFDENFLRDTAQVLLWFSGKDILAGMEEWLNFKDIPNPGAFRAIVRNWIIDNPERTLELLPEWHSLVHLLRGSDRNEL